MLVKLVQALNAPAPIVVTEEGMFILVNPEHNLNACAPIVVISLPIITLLSPVKFLKALLGIEPL